MTNTKIAYDKTVADTYDSDREVENHWQEENNFILNYFSGSTYLKILDIPIGTGRFAEYYPRNAKIVGVDISTDMLEKSKNKVKKLNLELLLGDAENLYFTENSFDVVVCCRLFHLLSNEKRGEVLKELSRVSSKLILLQVYLSKDNPANILIKFKRKIKSLLRFISKLFRQEDKNKPWSHIKSYPLTRTELYLLISQSSHAIIEEHTLSEYCGSTVCFFVLGKL
jgi:ubiquinone/menaquinone biosynthesis C-methylase UbiE